MSFLRPVVLILSLSPLPAFAGTVSDCYDGACATIAAPDCVAPGEAFALEVEGLLEQGGGFAVSAYGLYENGEWRYDEGHMFEPLSGTLIDRRGFNFGGVSRRYELLRPEGRYRYTFFFGNRGFGHNYSDVAVETEVMVGGARQAVAVDIKPTSCPNPLNVGQNGVVSVAVVGSADFDLAAVDPATVRLGGVAPLHHAYEDVTTPYLPVTGKQGEMACHTYGADGVLDLTLKFRASDLTAALEERLGRPLKDREALPLELTAETAGSPGTGCGGGFYGEDVVRIVTRER